MITYYTFLIILNFLILFFSKNLLNQFKILDKPDGIRKFQKNPVALLGGTFILINILTLIFFDYFLNTKFFLIISLLQIENFLHLSQVLFHFIFLVYLMTSMVYQLIISF